MPMRFESFQTKSGKKWQKAEQLTLLPTGGSRCCAALILAIFGTPRHSIGFDSAARVLALEAKAFETGSTAADCAAVRQGLLFLLIPRFP